MLNPRPRKPWKRLLSLVAVLALLGAGCAVAEDGTDQSGDGGGALTIGYILPETGPLAFLGPPMIQGVKMAIEEINVAGGEGGGEVVLLAGDGAGDAAVASETAAGHLADGVNAIIGAAASGISLAIIDQVTGAGVVQCSPSNTSPTFTNYDDKGYYFRTAPTDALQGPVLADLVIEDGHDRVAILARADDYGKGLAGAAADALKEGGVEVVLNETYDPAAATLDAAATAAAAADPDAVIVISFEEGVALLRSLLEAGFSPDQLYGADGIASEELNASIDPENPNAIDGFEGTRPSPAAVEGFLDRLQEFDPDLEETIYAPQSYDCAMLIALASVAADSVESAAIRDGIVDLSTGDNKCSGFEECAALLQDRETIDYQFASGIQAMTQEGEPVNGTYQIWEWQDGEFVVVDSREISLEN